ncbi:Dnaj homolog subfamily b member 14 [Phtheirospermum japonicum]|uniref:Dnaj homolog subfamily b member 14 n=1 Tax=Phtheirospermum japonicum TaxID=374723 RepID=A0A830CCT3_9LAMI|nr:Dnaj homolog subfamily b member 14 [Phtheirospermum japonicum]
MECNKDEAVRAKEIAEKKFLERDITGAKKFALKAQSLFPKLDGLSQFLEIINVNVVHEKKINGEANYYEILGVDPFADELVLKKQYRRMALSLHPDKNRSVGADEAFKLLSRAWDVLSDMDKRSSYNLKINIRGSNQTGATHEGMRNQIGSLSSSCAKYTTISATNPKPVPTRPKTPGTTTRRHCTSGSGFKHIPSRHQTPAAATVTGKLCNPVSSLNREKPVKTGPTNSAKEGSQGFKWGSTNLKGNISTTHSVIRKHSSDQKTVKNK